MSAGATGEEDLLHILVIDDDEAMRDLVTSILLPGGHQVVPVGSAEEALQLLPYYSFQIGFFDNNLPGMEGHVLAEYLRKSNPDMEIVIVSGAVDDGLRRAADAIEVSVVQKPFVVGDILDVVSRYREKAEARAARRSEAGDPDHALLVGPHLDAIASSLGVTGVPKRIEERLRHTIKRCLNDLRSRGRYNERDRALAFAAIVTLRALGLESEKTSTGRRYEAEFDHLMAAHGRRAEFAESGGRREDERNDEP